MGLFDFFKKKSSELKLNYDPDQIVKKLDELGYFKYAELSDIPEIKKDLIDSLTRLNYLGSVSFDESPYNSKEYRHYHFDGEDLFEEGGFIWQLEAMKTLFEKMNFKTEISNHIEDWDNEKGLNHFITLNGKEYVIFKNFNSSGWGEAAQRFAEIINDQLELQDNDERLYLVNGGNDGNAVYLTDKQFELLDPILKGKERPLKIDDWCKIHQVDRQNYNRH
ncbi:MAG TPA: hypothetical protein VK772_00790 [Puia sp.]|jgi:hypothetical protein|nr:hypothetical protein [Puia sp.]